MTWLVSSWQWYQFLLQSGDSVFQLTVCGFVLSQQPGVACLQDVKTACHSLYLLLHLFGVGALCCHLQDKTSHCLKLNMSASVVDCAASDPVILPLGPAVRLSSESVFPSPLEEP